MPAPHQRLKAYLLLLVNTVCWGAAFVIVAPALDHTTPYQFLLYRFVLASVLVLPLMVRFLKEKANRAVIWKIIGIETVGMVIALSLLYEGLARSTAIEVSLLATTAPLFIIVACILFLREKQTRQEWLGLAVSLLGMSCIAALPLFDGSVGVQSVSLAGNMLIVLSNIANAFYIILVKRHYKKIPPFFAVGISFWFGAVIFGASSLYLHQFSLSTFTSSVISDWQQPSVIFATLYMAIFGSIIALTAYIKAQKMIEASEASLFYYLQPLVYLPLAIVVLGERVSMYQLLGLALIIIGVIIGENRSKT